MEITQELVERIAQLTRLSLTQEEKSDMCAQLKDVLERVTDLNRLQLAEDSVDESERGGEGE